MPKKGINRTKTGCATCKTRKVKCDETRPKCNRCRNSGRQCIGFSPEVRDPNQTGYRKLLPVHYSSKPQTVQLHNRPVTLQEGKTSTKWGSNATIFDFFRGSVAPELAAQNASEFWLRLVLQACHSEQSVWHAAGAFGAIHRVYKDNGTTGWGRFTDTDSQVMAFRQYHQAVTSLQDRLKQLDSYSMQVILITCILLICFDLLSNRYQAALTHLKSGLCILSECQNEAIAIDSSYGLSLMARKLGRLRVDETLCEPLELLEIQAIFFGMVRLRQPAWPQATILAAKPLPPQGFRNLVAARKSLEHIIECVGTLVVEADEKSPHCSHQITDDALIQQKQRLQDRLHEWYVKARRLFTNHDRIRDFSTTCLHVHYYADWILLNTALAKGNESAFDSHLKDFEQIVELADQCMQHTTLPTFSMQYGIIAGLYYTALKCRDPKIRRRAINLLKSSARREGMWESTVAAEKATLVMEKEEAGLMKVEKAADVPESSRIQQLMLVRRIGERPVSILRQNNRDRDGSFVMFDASTGEEYIPNDGDIEISVAQWKLYIVASTVQ